MLNERPAPDPEDQDDRLVTDAFPTPPEPIGDPILAADILDILKKHNDRITSEVQQITRAADAATQQAQAASAVAARTEEVLSTVVKETAELRTAATTTDAAVTQLTTVVEKQPKATALAVHALETFGERLAGAALFLTERLPALGSLAAAAWLWNRALPNPEPLQLVLLGLWLPVIGVAFWMGTKHA